MRIITNQTRAQGGAQATVAQVSYSGSEGFGALGEAESRGVPVFAPRGISYRPREGDRLLLLRADGADICVGCLASQDALQAGELMLASSGGARIHLKSNGEISLNGLRISAAGAII
jgi:hypothetical protein